MPASPALTRLSSGHYNTGDWNATTNQGGMGGDGHRQALVPPKPPQVGSYPVLTADMAAVAAEVGGTVAAAQTAAATAAQTLTDVQTVAAGVLGGPHVQAVSTSTLTVVTGVSQPFQVLAGKAYFPGMPVRFAAQAPSTLILDGRIDTYDPATGAGTFTALRSEGSGSAAAWNVMLIGQPVTAVGGFQTYLTEVASLAVNNFVTIPTPGITTQAAARRRLVTVMEAGVSAQAFSNVDHFNFADRTKFSFVQTDGAATLTIPSPWQAQTSVALGSGYWTGKGNISVLDMATNVAVIVWTASSTGYLNAQVVNYTNPAAPTLGSVNTLSSSYNFSVVKATRVNSGQFAVLTRQGNYIGGASCTISGTTISNNSSNYTGWQIGYVDGQNVYDANFNDAVFAVAGSGGTTARAIIPARLYGHDSYYGRSNNGWIEVYYSQSSISVPSTGAGLNFWFSANSYSTPTVQLYPLHTGAVMVVQQAIPFSSYNQTSGTRYLSVAFTGVEGTASRIDITYNENSTYSIQAAGPCAPGSGPEAWLCYQSNVSGEGVRFNYVTISRSGSTLSLSAPVFDATQPSSPSWSGSLFNNHDGYPGHTFAYRRGGGAALRLDGAVINQLSPFNLPEFISNNRAWGFSRPDAGSMQPQSFVGAQGILSVGAWQAGDVGKTLYLSGGTARIASVSLGTATLERVSGTILDTVNNAGTWSLSPLLFSQGQVAGNSMGPQALATGSAGQLNARRWKSLNSISAVTTSSVWLALSFDNRRTWRIPSGGASRIVASDRAVDHGGADGVWYSRDGANGWTGPKADMLTALRDALGGSSANQAVPSVFGTSTALTQAGWTVGWNATLDFALVLASASAAIDSLTVNYSAYELFRHADGANIQIRNEDPEGVMVTRTAGSGASLRIYVQY